MHMIYTKLTAKAMKLAYEYHDGQLDKAGLPYIFHVYAVADKCTSEYSTCVGLLHDILEDTNIEYSLLEQEFPVEVVQAVEILTRDNGVTYKDYIKSIITNKLATEVKLRDLENNMNKQRSALIPGGKKDSLVERYKWAYAYLTNAITANKQTVIEKNKTDIMNKKVHDAVEIREQDNYLVYGSALRYGLDIRNEQDDTMSSIRTYFYTNFNTFSANELLTLSRDVIRINDKDININRVFRDDVILVTIVKNIVEHRKSTRKELSESEILYQTQDVINDIGRYSVPHLKDQDIQIEIDYFYNRLREALIDKSCSYKHGEDHRTIFNNNLKDLFIQFSKTAGTKNKSIMPGTVIKYTEPEYVTVTATKQTWNRIMMAAFYYSLGRRTYIVSTVSEFIAAQNKWLFKKNIEKIIETIKEASKKPERLGDSCDRADWFRLCDCLEKSLK